MTPVTTVVAMLTALAGVTGTLVFAARAIWDWSGRRMRRRCESWERAAPSLGLAPGPSSDDAAVELRGRREGLDVSVALMPFRGPGATGSWHVRMRVDGRGKWPAHLALGRSDTLLTAVDPMLMALPGPRLLLGLPDFDRAVHVSGAAPDVMATLDPRARTRLMELAGRVVDTWGHDASTWRVENARIEWLGGEPRHGPTELAGQIDDLVALGAALDRRGRSVARCLADNVREDAELRASHLAALVEGFPQDELTLEACRAALEDADVSMRLIAAKQLGREGEPTLMTIVDDEDTEAWRRVAALTAWEALPPTPEEAKRVLEPLLAAGSLELRLAAIGAAGRLRCAAVLPALVRLTRQAVREHAGALAMALRLLGVRGDGGRALAIAFRLIADPSTEDAVAELLEAGDEEVQCETLRALAVLGTAASVERLLPLATGLLVPRAVKVAARDALLAIRSRLGPVEAGRLSLLDLEGVEGDLSLGDDAEGRISLRGDGEVDRGDGA